MNDRDKLFLGNGYCVFAPTMGEARAKIKKALHVPKKGRLPVGFKLRRWPN